MMDEYQTKSRAWISIITYLAIFYLVSVIISMVAAYIYSKNSGYDYKVVIGALGNVVEDDDRLKKAGLILNGIVNFSSYILLFGSLCVILFPWIKEDAIKVKENPKKYIILMVICAILFSIAIVSLDKLAYIITKVKSDNQYTIEQLLKTKEIAWTMIIIIIIFGPVVEELVFRKSIFNLCKKLNWIIPLVLSSVCFALPHLVSTNNIAAWKFIIIAINYLASGLGLAFIYKYSDENIFVSLAAHVANNVVALIILFV